MFQNFAKCCIGTFFVLCAEIMKKKKCCLKRQIEIAFVPTVGQAVKDHVLFNSVGKAIISSYLQP